MINLKSEIDLISGESGNFFKNYLLDPVLDPTRYGEVRYNATHIVTILKEFLEYGNAGF